MKKDKLERPKKARKNNTHTDMFRIQVQMFFFFGTFALPFDNVGDFQAKFLRYIWQSSKDFGSYSEDEEILLILLVDDLRSNFAQGGKRKNL